MINVKLGKMENEELFKKYRTVYKNSFFHYRMEMSFDLQKSLRLALKDLKTFRDSDSGTEADMVKADVVRIWSSCVNHIEDRYQNGMTEEDVRVCDHCGLPMIEGFYLAGEYACDEECCLALYNGDKGQMEEDLSHAGEADGDCYYTEWESLFLD